MPERPLCQWPRFADMVDAVGVGALGTLATDATPDQIALHRLRELDVRFATVHHPRRVRFTWPYMTPEQRRDSMTLEQRTDEAEDEADEVALLRLSWHGLFSTARAEPPTHSGAGSRSSADSFLLTTMRQWVSATLSRANVNPTPGLQLLLGNFGSQHMVPCSPREAIDVRPIRSGEQALARADVGL